MIAAVILLACIGAGLSFIAWDLLNSWFSPLDHEDDQ